MVPSGCTSLVQPLDVCINRPFKSRIEVLSQEHYQRNIKQWTEQKFTASERRILMTKWVAQAWKDICKDHMETIIRSFRECGITVAPDGSEDYDINIRGLDSYTVPSL